MMSKKGTFNEEELRNRNPYERPKSPNAVSYLVEYFNHSMEPVDESYAQTFYFYELDKDGNVLNRTGGLLGGNGFERRKPYSTWWGEL